MKCVIMTFGQYIKIGLKEFFITPQKACMNFGIGVFCALVGMIIGYYIIQFAQLLGIAEAIYVASICIVGFAIVVDLLGLLIFLAISWRKAAGDCWDKLDDRTHK